MKSRFAYRGAGCLAAALLRWLACGDRIAGEKRSTVTIIQGGEVPGQLSQIPLSSHPLAMAAQGICQAFGEGGFGEQLTRRICAAEGERKVVDLTTLCVELLGWCRSSASAAVDTALLSGALAAAREPIVLYPYWKQRKRWSKGVEPPAPVAVVWCDPSSPESDTVEGYLVGTGEKVAIRDGQARELAVLVAAYPEFGGRYENLRVASGGETLPAVAVQHERLWQLKWIHIYDDHEPDWLEPPEFYVQANYGGGWEKTSITPPVNNTSPWTLNGV